MKSTFLGYEKVNISKETKLKEGMVVTSKGLPDGNWLIISVVESQPYFNEYNRMVSYTNNFEAVKVDEKLNYDLDKEKIKFSSAYVYSGSIPEEDIEIVKQLIVKYVDPDKFI